MTIDMLKKGQLLSYVQLVCQVIIWIYDHILKVYACTNGIEGHKRSWKERSIWATPYNRKVIYALCVYFFNFSLCHVFIYY